MEPVQKKQKTTSTGPCVYHRFPPEIRNQLYLCAALTDKASMQERSYMSVNNDGSTTPMDIVHEFYVDAVASNGKSTLFNREITHVTSIAEELLTLVTPSILFTFDSPDALRLFADTFFEHSRVCKRKIELHIELDFTVSMAEDDREAFAAWEETDAPHGKEQKAHEVFQAWLEKLAYLPKESTHLHLQFPCFWRDFRSLRGLSAKTGLTKFSVNFAFPGNDVHRFPDAEHAFFVAQTIAAVRNIEVVEQAGINKDRREKLVRFGCRGFNRPTQSLTAA